jgi:hypothetical protein
MATIFSPNRPITDRKVMCRLKAYRFACWSVAFALLAMAALVVRVKLDATFSIWAHWFGFAACGFALTAAISAVVFRIVETPREVSVDDRWYWPRKNPPVIYLDRKL